MITNNKRAQIAIWIIVAVAVVVVVLLLFVVYRKPVVPEVREISVQEAIEACAKKAVDDVANIMISQGGFVNPGNGRLFNGIPVAYLCSSRTLYKPCVNQHPMLLDEMKLEIINYSKSKIEECFDSVRTKVESENGKIELGNMDLSIEFAPRKIILDIKRDVELTSKGQTIKIDGFNVQIINPIYDLTNVAIVISNEEAKRCYFEYVGYSLLHPEIIVSKFTQSDSTRIYSIKDQESGKTMNTAIRGCVINAGLG